MAVVNKFSLLGAGVLCLLAVAPAYAQESDDPLAAFKQRKLSEVTQVPADTADTGDAEGRPPLPTPGGFQVPGDAAAAPQDQQSLEESLTFEAMQMESQMSLEEQQKRVEKITRDTAYDAAINGLMPLRPEEIRRMLMHYKESREAAEERIGGVPTPEVAVETVSLDPGSKPPIVKLSPGHVTSINILDITGQPWPIENVSWGGDFEVISPQEGGHVIKISPLAAHTVGNLSVQLVTLKTPVTFTLLTYLDTVQYRFDARIPEYGPYADMPIIDQGITTVAGDGALTTVLQGIIPTGATRMTVTGVDGRTTVYRYENATYVRTPLSLLSPGWSKSASSADGTTVYVVENAPVLLLSDRGKMVRAIVEDKESME